MRAYEWKSALSLTLLVMILMRLVWMDLRSYVTIFGSPNRHAFGQQEEVSACAHSFEQRLTRQLSPVDHPFRRPGWAHAWAYHEMLDLSCKNGLFSVAGFVRYNQGLLIVIMLLLVLLTRIVTRSWIFALLVAVGLLSRGRLIAANGQIGADFLLSAGLALWGLSLAHWLRSGSIWLLGLCMLSQIWLVHLEQGFIFLAVVLPLLISLLNYWENGEANPLADHMRHVWPWSDLLRPSVSSATALMQIGTGGILRPSALGVAPLLREPRFGRQSYFVIGGGFAIVLVELAVLIWGRHDLLKPRGFVWTLHDFGNWLQLWLSPIDRDLGLALCTMVLAMLKRPSWLPGLRPLLMAALLGLFFSAVGSLLGDALFLPGSSPKQWMGRYLLIWWEPLLLTLGMLGFYQLLLGFLPRLRGLLRRRPVKFGLKPRKDG